MSRTSIPNISDTIVEIGKRLQGLKAHKETLDEEIDKQIDLRDMLTAKNILLSTYFVNRVHKKFAE